MLHDCEAEAACSRVQPECECCGAICRYGARQCDLCGAECCSNCIEEEYGYRVCRDCRE